MQRRCNVETVRAPSLHYTDVTAQSVSPIVYYSIKIGDREYWANVKIHMHFGEVLYTIEKEKPGDLIKGHKKSDTENVYSFLQGTGAIDIRITAAKIHFF